MSRLLEFVQTYRLYRRHNTVRHAARIAYECAFRGAPF